MPFWHGDTLGRSAELGAELGRSCGRPPTLQPPMPAGISPQPGSTTSPRRICSPISRSSAATGRLPDDRTVIVERFRDELGDWRVVIHSPFGARVHAPWALAIGSRLRASLGMDVSVFHADDGVVLRIADTDDPGVWATITDAVLVDPDEIVGLVTEELGGSALFAARFRERGPGVALPKRDPVSARRCGNNGREAPNSCRWPPDTPPSRSCWRRSASACRTSSDISRCRSIDRPRQRSDPAARMRNGETEPFATSLLFGYVAAYLYEGDSPLAERRAPSPHVGCWTAGGTLGETELRDLLDPGALEEAVEAEVAWLTPERRLRDAEAVADALRVPVPMTPEELTTGGFARLDQQPSSMPAAPSRFTLAAIGTRGHRGLRSTPGRAGVTLPVGIPHAFTEPVADPPRRPHRSLRANSRSVHHLGGCRPLRHRARGSGCCPDVWPSAAASPWGQFRPGGSGTEWCDAEVLPKDSKAQCGGFCGQAEPVCQQAYADFLPAWQHLRQPERGAEGLLRVIEQLAARWPRAPWRRWWDGSWTTRQPLLDELTSQRRGAVGRCRIPSSTSDGWLVFTPSICPSYCQLPTEVAGDCERPVDRIGRWSLVPARHHGPTRTGCSGDPRKVTRCNGSCWT